MSFKNNMMRGLALFGMGSMTSNARVDAPALMDIINGTVDKNAR